MVAQRILLILKEVLGQVVLSILHCKEKAHRRLITQGGKVYQKPLQKKNTLNQTSKTAKESVSKLQLGTTWKQRDRGGSNLKKVLL